VAEREGREEGTHTLSGDTSDGWRKYWAWKKSEREKRDAEIAALERMLALPERAVNPKDDRRV
jgi:hypothetical protein